MSIAHWYSQYEQQLQRSLQLWISSANGHVCSSWVCSPHVQRLSTLSSCSILLSSVENVSSEEFHLGRQFTLRWASEYFNSVMVSSIIAQYILYLNPLPHPQYPRVEPEQVICLPFFQHPSANLVIGLMMLSVRCNCSLQNKLQNWWSWIGFEPI